MKTRGTGLNHYMIHNDDIYGLSVRLHPGIYNNVLDSLMAALLDRMMPQASCGCVVAALY